jgi:hypothetical protein
MHLHRGYPSRVVYDDLVQRTAGAGAGPSVLGVRFLADHDALSGEGEPGKKDYCRQ